MNCRIICILSFVAFLIPTVDAQTSPVVAKFQCHFDPSISRFGHMNSTCFAPTPPYRDAYLCYYNSEFDSEFGTFSVGLSLLLPPVVFTDQSAQVKKVCLRSSGFGYSGSIKGPLPFTYGGATIAVGQTGTELLANCAIWADIGKVFTINAYSGQNPEPWITDDTIRCELKMELAS